MSIKLLFSIRVFSSKDAERPIFERIVDWNSGTEFPFGSVLRSLRVLYGSKCVIEIREVNYE